MGARKMGQFTFEKCLDIEGLYTIIPKVFSDERGYNLETYNSKDFKEAGLDMEFVQANRSMSRKGTLRGLHFQKTYQQGKLVSVTSGEVFDVAVDIRNGSTTYGKWFGVVLSAERNNMLYVPEGFAHGFLVLSDIAVFTYHLTDYYHPEDESGIPWNDKTLGIRWPIPEGMNIITSERDSYHPAFSEGISLKPKRK
jgi:dTDP-4-dehydrorhamnose 3,5-epimerase